MAEDGSGDVVAAAPGGAGQHAPAGLEMGREGAASLSQGQAFGEIVVVPAVRPESAHADPQAEVNLDRRPRAHLATS
jgi:hypothetical protein